MSPSSAGYLGAVLALAVALLAHPVQAEAPRPPLAKRSPVTLEHHGISHTDDYAWLETENLEGVLQRPEVLQDPIRRHLEAEGQYARAMLASNRELERQLVAEMRGRISRRDEAVPERWGPWEYYTRYQVGSQRKLHCRRPREGGPEQVLLDENALARGRRAFSVAETAVSPDHKLLAYSVEADGAEPIRSRSAT
jgi:oligopeptidase B